MGRRRKEDTQLLFEKGRDLIEKEGLSDTKAALAVGVSQGSMSRYMRNFREESPATRAKGAKKKRKEGAAKPGPKKKVEQSFEFAQIPLTSLSGKKTLLIVTEDSDVIDRVTSAFLR